jgi:hypothetical protein
MTTLQRLLAATLVATLAATFWPAGEDPVEGVVRSEPRRAQPASRPVAAEATVQTGVRAASAERLPRMQADLFPRQTWVPPPPPYTPPPPPAPAPPPLPFKYLGRWVDDGRLTVFLVQGDQPIPVESGQVLPGNWRVDEITARSVMFTYLPLDMQSTLGITP